MTLVQVRLLLGDLHVSPGGQGPVLDVLGQSLVQVQGTGCGEAVRGGARLQRLRDPNPQLLLRGFLQFRSITAPVHARPRPRGHEAEREEEDLWRRGDDEDEDEKEEGGG